MKMLGLRTHEFGGILEFIDVLGASERQLRLEISLQIVIHRKIIVVLDIFQKMAKIQKRMEIWKERVRKSFLIWGVLEAIKSRPNLF